MTLTIFLVIFGISCSLLGYAYYLKDIFKNHTKPHAFTWLIWGVLMLIGCAGQLSDRGGYGAIVTGFGGLISFIIFALALKYGEKNIYRSDWYCLTFAFLSLIVWFFTSAVWAMVLITVIDMVGYIPTIRKSFSKPHEETLQTYWLGSFSLLSGIAALDTFSLTTLMYPSAIIIANVVLIGVIMVRKKKKVLS